jgi:hypothetical protein
MPIRKTYLILILAIVTVSAAIDVSAQRRDYLTAAEIEIVRDAQEIDLRVSVLTYAVDRRFAVLGNQPITKENEKWGPSPKGTRIELISDLQKIIQKAIDDIDDVAARDAENKLFPKAIWSLADSCTAYGPKFKSLLDAVVEEKERGSILTSIDLCTQVIDAAARVPKEPAKVEKKKKKSDN